MFEDNDEEKEWELKMGNRHDLMQQIQEKMKRKHEEEIKDREYEEMMERNLKKMEEIDNK